MMMNKPLAITDKPFKSMKTNTSKEKTFYTQGQRFAARVLFILWLLASGSPEGILAAPKRQLPPDSPGSFWDSSVASTPAINAALQRQRPSRIRIRGIEKRTSRVVKPRRQAAPRILAGFVAEGVTEGSSPAPPSALEELISQVDVLDNHTLGQALHIVISQMYLLQVKGAPTQEQVLKHLGAIALASLAQGTGQISDEQVRQAIKDSQVTLELLVDIGLLQA